MRKQKHIRVESHPPIVPGRRYTALVAELRVRLKQKELYAFFELLGKEQDGRIEQVVLPLPARPSGRTARFLRACGVALHAGSEIDPQEVLGRKLVVRFETDGDGGNGRTASFERARKERGHAQR